MKNKINKKIIIIFGALIFITILIIGILNFNGKENELYNKNKLFFYDLSTKSFTYEERKIKKEPFNEALQDTLNEFVNTGPKKNTVLKSVPSNIEIKSASLNDKIYTVKFSGDYNNLSLRDEIIFRTSFVWTMTELDFVNSIDIYVENNLLQSKEEYLGNFTRMNTELGSDISPTRKISSDFTLYIPNYSKMKLIKEKRSINFDPNQGEVKYILEELFLGSKNLNDGVRLFPETVKIKEIKITDDICFIDLNVEFLNSISSSKEIEELQIYSIVNTLTSKENIFNSKENLDMKITKVQFLIESAKVQEDKYKGSLDLTQPLENNNNFDE